MSDTSPRWAHEGKAGMPESALLQCLTQAAAPFPAQKQPGLCWLLRAFLTQAHEPKWELQHQYFC